MTRNGPAIRRVEASKPLSILEGWDILQQRQHAWAVKADDSANNPKERP